MPFELPNDCDSLKVPELPDSQKLIVDAVMSGDAFQNPFGDALGGVGDMLSGEGGIGESIASLLDGGGLDGGVVEMLEGLQDSLGFNDGGASGILGTLSEFRGHMDMLSGVGSLSDFSERLGIGTALEGAKQELGLGAGGFGDMFSSFENGGALLDNIGGQLGNLKNMLTEAVGAGGDAFDFDITAMSAIGAGILTFGDDILGQINLDNGAFGDAKDTLQKMGIAKMVTTDSNCYVNKLLTGMIGKSNVVSALPKALAEKVGPTLTETEKLALEQSKKSKIEEVKAKGIKSEKAAEILGKSQTDKPEEIEKVKSRPVYTDIPMSELAEDGWDYIKMGEPMWDENAYTNPDEEGAWIQWIQKLSVVEKIIQLDENGVSNITDNDIDGSVLHNELLPVSGSDEGDKAIVQDPWPYGLGNVAFTSTVRALVWRTGGIGQYGGGWDWYNIMPHTMINSSIFGSKWLLDIGNQGIMWRPFEYGDQEKTKKTLTGWPTDTETLGWRASGYIIARNIFGSNQLSLLNPNV